MHVVLGLLTSILTILYLLDRLGVDLGGLNPFHWRRRRAWATKYDGDPIYSVDDPMQIAALLVVGVAKLEGDLSADQKQAVLDQFQSSFSLDSREASELLGSAAHLLGGPQVIDNQLSGVATRNKDRLSVGQAKSMLDMIVSVASIGGGISGKQSEFIESVRSLFIAPQENDSTWS